MPLFHFRFLTSASRHLHYGRFKLPWTHQWFSKNPFVFVFWPLFTVYVIQPCRRDTKWRLAVNRLHLAGWKHRPHAVLFQCTGFGWKLVFIWQSQYQNEDIQRCKFPKIVFTVLLQAIGFPTSSKYRKQPIRWTLLVFCMYIYFFKGREITSATARHTREEVVERLRS